MNDDQLELAIRETLRENVEGISSHSLNAEALGSRRSGAKPSRSWGAPLLAAAAVLAVVAGAAALLPGHGGDAHQTQTPPAGFSSVSLAGSWRLVSGKLGGKAVTVPIRPSVTLIFGGGSTLLVDDGVNTTTIAMHQNGDQFAAHFAATTYAYDSGATGTARRSVLRLLDSIAPGSSPSSSTNSSYQLTATTLAITTQAGTLNLTRQGSAPGASQTPTAVTSSTPAASVPAAAPSSPSGSASGS